jgi:DNA modification methylase
MWPFVPNEQEKLKLTTRRATDSREQERRLAMTDNLDQILVGHAAKVLADFPVDCIDCIITSPPHYNAVTYSQGVTWSSYGTYLADMQSVWTECARVLRPNGKLCVNAPLMPIPQAIIKQDTRHLKNIAFDIEHGILSQTKLQRYGLFIWRKQTSKQMFGSYPHPGNLLENNTSEFINVYVKPGKPPKFSAERKAANKLTDALWTDLIQQIWNVHPSDVKRVHGHPAPFPEKLPARLLRLYTYSGEIVLDPFVGTGTTCAVAKSMGRHYIGIDIVPEYVTLAEQKVRDAPAVEPLLLVGRPRYPGRDELIAIAAEQVGNAGKAAEAKHKRKTYGRAVTTTKKEAA